MRKIKFRAWDKKELKMMTTGFSLYGNGSYLHLWQYQADCNYGTIKQEFSTEEKLARFDIIQFTGLYDKNGKEIYEGDIIQLNDRLERIEFEDEIDRDGMSFAAEWAYPFDISEYEIIGNVYENPELLEVSCEKP